MNTYLHDNWDAEADSAGTTHSNEVKRLLLLRSHRQASERVRQGREQENAERDRHVQLKLELNGRRIVAPEGHAPVCVYIDTYNVWGSIRVRMSVYMYIDTYNI